MHFQRFTRLLLLAGFSLSLAGVNCLSTEAVGQEAEVTLNELQQQWMEIDAKLSAKESELETADGDVETLQKEFQALVDEANSLIKKLESTARQHLESTPDDPDVVRTLMGIMVNDAQFNRDGKVLELGDLLIANGVNPEYFKIASRSERLSIPAREIFDELIIRHAEAMKSDLPRVKFSTTKGDIVLELFENEAPETVGNFVSLVESGYYTDMIFHRVIEGFMAQGGGFKMDGDKQVGGEGPGYAIKCECDSPEKRLHFSRSLSMAHRGKDTGGSQFFLTFERTSFLDGLHTCFGRVVEGQEVLDLLSRTHITDPRGEDEPIPGVTKDKIKSAEVIRKRDHEYLPNKVGGDKADNAKVDEKMPELTAPLTAPKTDEKKTNEADSKIDESKIDESKKESDDDPTDSDKDPKSNDEGKN